MVLWVAEHFVELGGEGLNYFLERHWDRAYDTLTRPFSRNTSRHSRVIPRATGEDQNTAPNVSALASATGAGGERRRQKNRLPSPEDSGTTRDRDAFRDVTTRSAAGANRNRDTSLDRQTETSEQILRAYESEPRDPIRKPETVLSRKDLNKLRNDDSMSYANGSLGAGYGQQQGGGQQRANSAQPPRSRYYDDDEEYGSDYDERTGRRYNTTGRGYDDRYDDDRGGDYRETIETERYKGPARDWDTRRQSLRSNDPYAAGAVTQYQRRGTQQDDDYYQSRRSRSRGSRGRRYDDRDSRSRSRSYSRSRSGSRGGGGGRERGLQQKVGEHFDTSLQGLGFGIAGAVVGGMAGRHFGERNPRTKNRDILIGALVGGLASNAAETKWKDYVGEKKEKVRGDEERWEQKWDGQGQGYGGRSRSSAR